MEEGKYNRDINCLKSRDKSVRISSLQRLLNSLPQEPYISSIFYLFKLPLIELLHDPADKCKELTVKLFIWLISSNSIPPEDLSHIIQGFHSRIGTEPCPETCEEVRINSITAIFAICQNYFEFINIELQRITDIVARGCKDKFPAVKIIAGDIIVFLSSRCKKLGFYARKIVENSVGNLFHQQYKIRISSLQALGSLLQCEGSYEIIHELFNDFKKVQLDRRHEVADALYEVVYILLKTTPVNFLKNIEGKFCYLLLSSEKKVIDWLEEIGIIRKTQESEEEKGEYSGALYVTMKNLKEIVYLCLNDLQEWTIQDNYRSKAGCALENILSICKHLILTYVDIILPVIFKAFSYESVDYLHRIIQDIGNYCDFTIVIDQFYKFCTSVNSSQDITSALNLLHIMLSSLPPLSISISPILDLISALINTEETQILRGIHSLIALLLNKFEASLPMQSIFYLLLVLEASSIALEIQNTINSLAEYGGITIQELYQRNLDDLFPILTKNYKYWDNYSTEPLKFAKLACKAQICNEDILQIICFKCKRDADDNIKSAMLDIIDCCINDSSYSQIILEEIIILTAAWKPNSIILRIKSCKSLIKLIKEQKIDGLALQYVWDKLFPVIRTCINDEHSDLRLVNIEILDLILRIHSNILEDKELLDIYPELLKRFDDSFDNIRISATIPFIIYFQILKEKQMKFGSFKYVITNLFIHLDDPSEIIQRAISKLLEEAAKYNPQDFLTIANEVKKQHKHPRAVGNLIEMAKTL